MPHDPISIVLKNRVCPSQAMLLRNQHSVLSCTSPPSFQIVAKTESISPQVGTVERTPESLGVSSDLWLQQS